MLRGAFPGRKPGIFTFFCFSSYVLSKAFSMSEASNVSLISTVALEFFLFYNP
ncbi:hypothetical protein LEP1GSC204_3789 [Leptospira interrogans serovar Copenhageni str. M20]|nr:hypothetical protein LEP1GSC080_0686 [Leptospira interrogans str. FPW2026]EMF73683.1 hypothetical protein LEP1GSC148_1235 [Leptospira interrogans serovar Canicola str. LT1962]EMY53491.1 hypothetical protein LEP1GSC204_3789 [Leptospira interrogans serovar Copenhageni str. M20]